LPGKGSSSGLPEKKLVFLKHVAKKPFLFHSERYKGLSLSGSKGNAIKKDLVRDDYFEETEINTRKRGANPKIVGLTKKGKQVLREKDVENVERGKGGLEHRFWQHTIAEHFEEKGYDAKIEHEIDGKSIDVYAENEERIGIEVAMSAKGEVENIKQNLKLGLDQNIVTCKYESIMSELGVKMRKKMGEEKIKQVKFQVTSDLL